MSFEDNMKLELGYVDFFKFYQNVGKDLIYKLYKNTTNFKLGGRNFAFGVIKTLQSLVRFG